MNKDAKRAAFLSVCLALSMVFSYIESFVPVPLPGVKLGLANALTLFLIYSVGVPSAIGVSLVRIFLSTLLFGAFPIGLVYSLFGWVLSIVAMLVARRLLPFGIVGISVIGAVMHNLGQVIAACLIMKTAELMIYFLPLLLSGTIAGTVIGILSGVLIKKLSGRIKAGL